MQNIDNIPEEQKVEAESTVSESTTVDTLENDSQNAIPTEARNEEVSDTEDELTPEEINWRKFRQGREADRLAAEEEKRKSHEKDAQIESLTHAIDQVLQSKGSPEITESQQEKIIAELMDEDIPTGGEVKNFLNQFVPDLVRDMFEKQEQKREKERLIQEEHDLPKAIRRENPNFDEVVNKENLDYLDYHYPEVASLFMDMPESKKKWSSVYAAVKKLVPSTGKNESKRIERNTAKPQAVSGSVGMPGSEAGYGRTLSASQKAQNYKRMVEAARQA